jgi:hypothetical protein
LGSGLAEDDMKDVGFGIILVGSAILGATTATLGQTTTFYVVQDTTTKRCTVVKERPAAKTMVIVGQGGKVYTTEEEARTAIKVIKVCEGTEVQPAVPWPCAKQPCE